MTWELIIIFVVTFFVRIVTAMFGGGGLIMLPLLITLGLTPSEAVATNRLGTQTLNLTILKFHWEKQMKWKLASYFIAPTLLGSLAGALVVLYIDQDLFKKLLGLVMILILPFLFLKKDLGLKEFKFTKRKFYWGLFFSVIAGFLGGAFASTGIWFTYLYLFLGLTMLQAAGTKKVTGLVLGLSTSIIFIFTGLINWPIMITIMIASALGGWIGASLGIKIGNVWVKRIFAIFVLAGAVKMIFF